MIWEIVKKQILVFIRNPQQIMLLIALPIVLIVILSISLSGLMNGETVHLDAKIALIEHGDEKEQIIQFIKEVEQSNLKEGQKFAIIEVAKQLPFIQILTEDIFDELKHLVQIEKVAPSEKETILKDDTYAAIMEVPQQFTYDTLHHIFLDQDKIGKITLYTNEGSEIAANVGISVVTSFQEQLTMFAIAERQQIDPMLLQKELENVIGEIISIEQSKPISSKEYYTIGMAVMNVLYIATAISSFAFLEKQSQVFHRVILSDVSRWTYFLGVFGSGTIFALVQLIIIFGFSRVIFRVEWPNLLHFSIVTVCLALVVGGFSVFLTAISYRMNSESVINFFGNILISFFALMGGSFFPIGELSNVVQIIGDFTPNGAGMTAYLSLLRGNHLKDIMPNLFLLMLLTIGLFVIAVISFPKRGQTS